MIYLAAGPKLLHDIELQSRDWQTFAALLTARPSHWPNKESIEVDRHADAGQLIDDCRLQHYRHYCVMIQAQRGYVPTLSSSSSPMS